MLEIYNSTKQRRVCVAEAAESFFSRLRGLMFRSALAPGSGLLIKFFFRDASVHSLFMRFTIDMVFLDESKRVVEITTLKPWRIYNPKQRSAYVLELNEGGAEQSGVEIGDVLEFRKLR